MKKNYKYGVIILNYNTANDAVEAAKSVISNSQNDDYIICIADNASTKSGERNILKNIKLKNTVVCLLDKNNGYACGNNEAFKWIRKSYNFKYTVIMNPDVIINSKNLIDELIEEVELEDEDIIGAQPLVNNIGCGINPEEQINIRRVASYSDCLMNSFWLFKRIFKKKYYKTIYKSNMPYLEKIKFEVPSGAFFLINTEVFESIGLFDEKTFLYGEENIIGFKLKNIQKQFILIPKLSIDHYQGKSTGSHMKEITKFSQKCEFNSTKYYLTHYLKINKFKIGILYLSMWSGYYTKILIFKFMKKIVNKYRL